MGNDDLPSISALCLCHAKESSGRREEVKTDEGWVNALWHMNRDEMQKAVIAIRAEALEEALKVLEDELGQWRKLAAFKQEGALEDAIERIRALKEKK